MRIINSIILAIASLLFINCGGDSPEAPKNPSASTLTSPLKDAECNTGTILSTAESSVTFQWKAADNAESYTLVLTNLNTKAVTQKSEKTNSSVVTLLRGVPYSWKVISKNTKTTITATSDTWKFYNAGIGVTNYAPFPAEASSPNMGSTTVNATVSLKWNASDIDNDITKYEVYLGTVNPPTTLHSTTAVKQVDNISLIAKTVYYWRIVTTDSKNNVSTSAIFDFRTP